MRLRRGIGKVIAAASLIGTAAFVFAALPSLDAFAEGEKEAVDTSKGITYDLSDSGSIMNYNLNGNSTIITTVSDENGTYYNMYIDKNSDGNIDEDETPVELPLISDPEGTEKSSNLTTGIPIYGAKNAKVTEPVTITVLNSESGVSGYIYGAVSCDVLSDISINLIDSNTNAEIAGIYGSTIQTGNIFITANNSEARALIGAYGGCRTKGNIAINSDGSTSSFICGVYSGSSMEGYLDITAMNSSVGTAAYNSMSTGIYGLAQGSSCDGNVSIITDEKFEPVQKYYSYYIYGAYASEITGDLIIDAMGNTGEMDSYGYIYGTYGTKGSNNNESPVVVGGKVDISVTNGKMSSVYGIWPSSTSSSEPTLKVNDNVTINLEGVTLSSAVYGVSKTYVTGDLSVFITGSTCDGLQSTQDNSYVEGSIIVDAQNSTVKNKVYGAYRTSVGEDLILDFKNSSMGYFSALESGMVGGNIEVIFDEQTKITSSYSCYGINSGAVTGSLIIDINNNINDSVSYGPSLYGLNSGSVGGELIFHVTSGIFNNVYGMTSGSVSGNADIEICNLVCTSSTYICGLGAYSSSTVGSVSGDTSVHISNVRKKEGTNNSIYIYGTYCMASLGEKHQINIENCDAYYIYGFNGGYSAAETVDVNINNCTYSSVVYGINDSSNSSHIDNNINLEISECKPSDSSYSAYIYGINGNYSSQICGGDATVNILNNTVYNLYTTNNFLVGGNININMTSNVSYRTGTSDSHGNCYIVGSYTRSDGKITATVKNNELNGVYFAQGYAKEGVDVDVIGGVYVASDNYSNGLSICPYYYAGNSSDIEKYNGDVHVRIKGAEFKDYKDSSDNIQNTKFYSYAGTNQKVYVTIDETTTMPSAYSMSLNSTGEGSGILLKLGSDTLYVNGDVKLSEDDLVGIKHLHFNNTTKKITKNLSLDNLYFEDSTIAIPENVIVKADEKIDSQNSTFILGGTLQGEFAEITEEEHEAGSSYKAETLSFYMNGGTCTTIPDKSTKYYPVTLEISKTGGNATFTKGVYTYESLVPDVSFSKAGAEVVIKATPEEGYNIKTATVTMDGDAAPRDMSATAGMGFTNYSFTMEAKNAAAEIKFAGGKISIGKTVNDPVAIVGKQYTEAEPLYDFDTLKILNDAQTGSLAVSLKTGEELPTGLSLSEGKLIGKVGNANKDGRDVSFDVIARNGSKGEVTLKIKSETSAGTVTPSPVGRLVLDEEENVINAFGNSVVIEAADDGTAIYMDDDMDSVKDSNIAALTGDFSEYTLIGLQGDSTAKPIYITMNGGRLAGIKGLYEAVQEMDDPTQDGIFIDIKDGYAGTVSMVDSSTCNAQIFGRAQTNKYRYFYTASGTSTNKNLRGYITVLGGNANQNGDYVLNRDLEVDRLTTSYIYSSVNCMMTVPKGRTLTVNGTVTTNQNSGIYVAGKMIGNSEADNPYSYTSASGLANGKIMVPEGGEFETKKDWNGVFYPYSYETDLKNTDVKLSSGIYIYYDSVYYLRSGITFGSSVTATYPEGYDGFYSVNGSEEKKMTSEYIELKTAYGPTRLSVNYRAKQIEVNNPFSKVTVEKDKEYTSTLPAFNYGDLTISNDTISTYAKQEKVAYEIVKGSLPDGLKLTNGKITGSTSKVGTETIVVRVTGLNGSYIDVPMSYEVKGTSIAQDDINNKLSYNSSSKELNLNGYSVVILPDQTTSGRANIYLDENHDGVADDTNPYLINGSKQLDLSSSTIKGYSDTSKVYDGDISIYMFGGNIQNIYGAYSSSETDVVKVSGDVSLHISGGSVSGSVAAGYNVTADNITFDATGGNLSYNVTGVYNPKDVKSVNFNFKDKAVYNGNSSSSLNATQGGNVIGDVNASVGSMGSYSGSYRYCYNIQNRYSSYYGVYNTSVGGDVNYTIEGNFVAYSQMHFIYSSSDIKGDLNVDWKSGNVGVGYNSSNGFNAAMLRKSAVRDINVNVSNDADTSSSYSFYPLVDSSTARNVTWNGKGSYTKTNLYYSNDGTSQITGYGYMYSRTDVYLMGDYTITEPISLATLSIVSNANNTAVNTDIKIAEGAEISASVMNLNSGKLTLQSGSKLIASSTVTTNAGTEFIIEKDAQFENTTNSTSYSTTVNGSMDNKGTINVAKNLTVNAGASLKNSGDINVSYYFYIHGDVLNEKTGTLNTYYTTANFTDTKDIVNNGTYNVTYMMNFNKKFINRGTFNIANPDSSYYSVDALVIGAGGELINEEDGTLILSSKITNGGTIYNYGTFRQPYIGTYYQRIGKVYMAAKPELLAIDSYGLSAENAYMSSSQIYYPVVVDYPENAFTGVTTNTEKSGIKGDDNLYMCAGGNLTVSFGDPKPGYTCDNIESVKIGETAFTATDSGVFSGKMPLSRAIVSVNMKETGDKITLNPDTLDIPSGQVGKPITSIDLKKQIAIEGDIESSEATVKYIESTKNPLPQGITINSNGVISGTPKYASEAEQTAVITVTGKNLTRAELTIKFGKIEKGIPSFSKPAPYGSTGYKLSEVHYSKLSTGTYAWGEDVNTVIDEKAIAGDEFKMYFYPTDRVNYDWSKVLDGNWNEDENRLEMMVSIKLYKIVIPSTLYSGIIPADGLDATYGDELSDIELPSNENGHFEWRYPDSEVGSAGTRYFQAYFVASDKDRYYDSNYAGNYYTSILVNVNKQKKQAPIFTSLNAFVGDTIGSISLPEISEGKYSWKSTENSVVEDSKEYTMVFVPYDNTNIEWDAGDRAYYSSADSGYIFYVTINISAKPVKLTKFPLADVKAAYGSSVNKAALPYVRAQEWYLDGTKLEDTLVEAAGVPDGNFEWVNAPTDKITDLNDRTGTVRFVPVSSEHVSEYTSDNMNVSIKIVHDHNYADSYTSDAAGHYKVCTICGENTEKTPHTFPYGYYHTAEGHAKKCTVCGYISELQEHEWNTGAVIKQATDEEDGIMRYTCKVCGETKDEEISIKPVPEYTVPTGLTATYGDTLGSVTLPTADNGKFTWEKSVSASVGNAGENTFTVTFTPNDDTYRTVRGIVVNISVAKKVVDTIPEISTEIKGLAGEKLSQVVLPKVEGGKYIFTNPNESLPSDEGEYEYQVVFTPNDVNNYEWPDNLEKTIKIKVVKTIHTHTLKEVAKVDAKCEQDGNIQYWVCTDPDCAKFFKDSVGNEEIVDKESVIVKKLGHDWGDVKYTWSADNKSVTAARTCLRDSKHIETETVNTVYKVTKAATESASGIGTYTAAFKNDAFTVQTKNVGIPKKEVKTEATTEKKTETSPVQPTTEKKPDAVKPENGEKPGTKITPDSGSKDDFTVIDINSVMTKDDPTDTEADDITGPVCIYEGPKNKSASTVIVPDTVKAGGKVYKVVEISDKAFAGCKKLKKVVIGNNVRRIGKNAFLNCKTLQTVTFKKTSHVKTIKNNAFKGCTSLKKITLPASVKYIKGGAFSGCTKLTSVTFAKKSKLISIGSKAFYNCKSLKSMKITSVKLKKVAKAAFKNAGKKSYKKFKVTVPKKNKKAYKKLLKKGGLNNKVKIK